MTQALKLTE